MFARCLRWSVACAEAIAVVGFLTLGQPAQAGTVFGKPYFEFADGENARWERTLQAVQEELRAVQACRLNGVCDSPEVNLWARLIDGVEGRQGSIVEIVNEAVNRLVRQRSDAQVHGAADVWSTPLETLRAGAGDCEDIAILKLATLAELGALGDDARLLVLRITAGRNAGDIHAVVLRSDAGEGPVVLDSLRPEVLHANEVRNYVPIYSVRMPTLPILETRASGGS